ncbi:MAG: tRNA lysidine(34) synthetase TilS [Alphaproteobacteria bacterium]|nr:tRNA lysidine(34) synthetase TilS [Alphaproteobacteria bacterium]
MTGHDGVMAVAVSGGGDSLALMHLLRAFAQARGIEPPVVLTVDHALRKSSAKDAQQVAAWAKQAGLKSQVLTWSGPKPKSGIEAAAREARYRLMGGWLTRHKIVTLAVGHTQDDQAETFLLRLARGSGLDGLAAMRPRAPWPVPGFAGLGVARPLLGFRRDDLRAYLKSLKQPWLDDPMNQDPAFDRVKIRKSMAALTKAGLTAERIAAAASHLARARESLEIVTEAVLARGVRPGPGGVLLDASVLAAAPREVGLRALAAVLMAVSGQAYRPRFESLERLFDQIGAGTLGRGATLHGCHIRPAGALGKDFGAVALFLSLESPRKTGSSPRGA